MPKENEKIVVKTNDGDITVEQRGDDLAWDVVTPWHPDGFVHYGDKSSLNARLRSIRAKLENVSKKAAPAAKDENPEAKDDKKKKSKKDSK